jgi:hypothetical protein
MSSSLRRRDALAWLGEVIFAARNSAQPNTSEGQGSQDGASEYSEALDGVKTGISWICQGDRRLVTDSIWV